MCRENIIIYSVGYFRHVIHTAYDDTELSERQNVQPRVLYAFMK